MLTIKHTSNSGFSSFRFILTYGILGALLFAVFLKPKPLAEHIRQANDYTMKLSKMQVLSYDTPDFSFLAQGMLEGHHFTPEEINTYASRRHFLSFFQKGAELFGDDFQMFYMAGVCSYYNNDFPSAGEAMERSLKLNRYFFWTYYNLGLLLLRYGRIDKALVFLAYAKSIPPAVTKKIMASHQAFTIILRFIPDPESYVDRRLEMAVRNIDYIFAYANRIRSRGDLSGLDPNRLELVFF